MEPGIPIVTQTPNDNPDSEESEESKENGFVDAPVAGGGASDARADAKKRCEPETRPPPAQCRTASAHSAVA